MADNLIERSSRPVHDQIIGHDLVGMDSTRLMQLLIIEVRRLREDMARYHSPRTQFAQQQRIVRPEDNGSGPAG